MDEQHRRLIKIGLDALAEEYGYALASGYAVQAHRIVDRLSDDVDLFAPIERATGEMSAAVSAAVAAYEAAGYTAEVVQQVPTYTRMNVVDPSTGTQNKVELVAEFLHHPPWTPSSARSCTATTSRREDRWCALQPSRGP